MQVGDEIGARDVRPCTQRRRASHSRTSRKLNQPGQGRPPRGPGGPARRIGTVRRPPPPPPPPLPPPPPPPPEVNPSRSIAVRPRGSAPSTRWVARTDVLAATRCSRASTTCTSAAGRSSRTGRPSAASGASLRLAFSPTRHHLRSPPQAAHGADPSAAPRQTPAYAHALRSGKLSPRPPPATAGTASGRAGPRRLRTGVHAPAARPPPPSPPDHVPERPFRHRRSAPSPRSARARTSPIPAGPTPLSPLLLSGPPPPPPPPPPLLLPSEGVARGSPGAVAERRTDPAPATGARARPHAGERPLAPARPVRRAGPCCGGRPHIPGRLAPRPRRAPPIPASMA